MSRHRLATDREIRDRIDAVRDERYRFAYRYQYLIAGRISEVCGKYAPRGVDAFEVQFVSQGEKIPAVLFAVRTAKRRGTLRPCAVPLDPEYEPWAEPLLEYFRDAGEDYPFRFHENWDTSKTYGMKRATEALKGVEWPMIEYTRSAVKPVVEEEILDVKIDDSGREKYLVAGVDGAKKWYTKAEDGFIKVGVKIPSRWKHATSHVFRKRRTITLTLDYNFGPIDLAWYGGWTEHSQATNMPAAIKHYLYIDVREPTLALPLLRRMAQRYFPKLLIPYGSVV